MVPRFLRYNGENRISRIVDTSLTWNVTPGAGYSIGLSQYAAFGMYFSPTGLTVQGSSTNFVGTNLPGISELSNLYDQIRVDKVEVTFMIENPPAPLATTGTGVSTPMPRLYVSTDYNDCSPNSIGQTEQQEGCRCLTFMDGRPKKYTLKPKYQQIVFYTSTNSAFAARRGFVDSNIDVPHYGLRVACPTTAGVNTHHLRLTVKFYFTCKNVK